MTIWNIDPTHTEVGFSARHLMVTTVKGRFEKLDARIEIDDEQPERSSVDVTIDAASITTNNDDRDAHLRSPDFFDVEQYPELRFRSTSVTRTGDGRFALTGDLTIRDVTRSVTLEGEFEGPVTDPWGGKRVGFVLSGEVDREAFGLTWNVALESGGVMVSKRIKLAIEAQVVATEPATV